MKDFGEQAYFVNIPSKFIDRADGRTMWLCYSANFSCISLNQVYRSVPTGSSYKMCLQEFRLVGRDEEAGASSVHKGYMSNAATDGAVAGWPGDAAAEWASDMERESAFIRLDWDKVQVLFFLVYFFVDMFIPKSKTIGVCGVLIELLLGVSLVILGVVFRRFG